MYPHSVPPTWNTGSLDETAIMIPHPKAHLRIATAIDPVCTAEIYHGNMATDLMAWLGAGMERGLLLLANGTQFAGTARVEDAAVRYMDGAGDLALQVHALLDLVTEGRDRGEQGRGIGMMRARKDSLGRTGLHQPAEIEHCDPVG